MTPRADFLAVLLRHQRRMDAERRAFAERVSDVVSRTIQGRESFDLMTYHAITRDLDPVFNDFYGAWPNDPRARFYRLIVDECRRAKAVPIRRAVEDVRQRLKRHPEVIRAIVKEAG